MLELEGRSPCLSVEDAQYVTDSVWKAATDFLDPAKYVVMTRENMDLIVPPSAYPSPDRGGMGVRGAERWQASGVPLGDTTGQHGSEP